MSTVSSSQVAVGRMSRGSHLGVAVAFWWRRRSAVAGAAVSLAAVAGGAVEVAAVAVGAVAAVAVSAGFVGLSASSGEKS